MVALRNKRRHVISSLMTDIKALDVFINTMSLSLAQELTKRNIGVLAVVHDFVP